jgi:hypothetical protein
MREEQIEPSSPEEFVAHSQRILAELDAEDEADMGTSVALNETLALLKAGELEDEQATDRILGVLDELGPDDAEIRQFIVAAAEIDPDLVRDALTDAETVNALEQRQAQAVATEAEQVAAQKKAAELQAEIAGFQRLNRLDNPDQDNVAAERFRDMFYEAAMQVAGATGADTPGELMETMQYAHGPPLLSATTRPLRRWPGRVTVVGVK